MRSVVVLSAVALSATAAIAAASAPISSGQWQITVAIDSMEMPGMPPGMAGMMKGMGAQTINHCVTEADAQKGPQSLMQNTDGSCQFTSYNMEGDHVSSVMQCTQRSGQTMTITTSGSYTPTSYTAQSHATMSSGMKSSSTVSGKLVGPCR